LAYSVGLDYCVLNKKIRQETPMEIERITPAAPRSESTRGFSLALSAYLLWGILPLYIKAVAHISPAEVLAHRVLWSIPIAAVVLIVLGQTKDLKAAFRSPRTILLACMTATLITINWGIYVWAIGAGHAIDAALGYFINPLFSIFLGAVLLKERLLPLQIAAISLAAVAVVILTWDAGTMPWVALGLTCSWGFYGFFRKTLPVGANQGFLLEVLLLSPAAIGYMIYLGVTGSGHFLADSSSDTILLLVAGAVTAIPLMLYGNGAKLLQLSTIGIMQYIAPTIVFLIAVFLFNEHFSTAKLVSFCLIWTALVIYTFAMLRQLKGR
jgi:chloramphenicol-sensitive protein RarD